MPVMPRQTLIELGKKADGVQFKRGPFVQWSSGPRRRLEHFIRDGKRVPIPWQSSFSHEEAASIFQRLGIADTLRREIGVDLP